MMTNKLTVLCLHGYLQNAEVFRSRMGSTRKALKSRCEFVFVDAPHIVDAATQAQLAGDDGVVDNARTWWRWTVCTPPATTLVVPPCNSTYHFLQDEQPGTRPSGAMHYEGWEASLDLLLDALQQHAPVHAIMGFSQGAAAASLLAAHIHASPSTAPLLDHLRAAVLVSGFVPHDARYAAVLQANPPRRVQSLHVMGERDRLVPNERGQKLVEAWGGGEVYVHEGGHFVPTCTGVWRQRLVEFVDEARRGL